MLSGRVHTQSAPRVARGDLALVARERQPRVEVVENVVVGAGLVEGYERDDGTSDNEAGRTLSTSRTLSIVEATRRKMTTKLRKKDRDFSA